MCENLESAGVGHDNEQRAWQTTRARSLDDESVDPGLRGQAGSAERREAGARFS